MHRRSRWWMVCTNASVTSILSLPLMNACCAVMQFTACISPDPTRHQSIHPGSYVNQSNSSSMSKHSARINSRYASGKFFQTPVIKIIRFSLTNYYEPIMNLYMQLICNIWEPLIYKLSRYSRSIIFPSFAKLEGKALLNAGGPV